MNLESAKTQSSEYYKNCLHQLLLEGYNSYEEVEGRNEDVVLFDVNYNFPNFERTLISASFPGVLDRPSFFLRRMWNDDINIGVLNSSELPIKEYSTHEDLRTLADDDIQIPIDALCVITAALLLKTGHKLSSDIINKLSNTYALVAEEKSNGKRNAAYYIIQDGKVVKIDVPRRFYLEDESEVEGELLRVRALLASEEAKRLLETDGQLVEIDLYDYKFNVEGKESKISVLQKGQERLFFGSEQDRMLILMAEMEHNGLGKTSELERSEDFSWYGRNKNQNGKYSYKNKVLLINPSEYNFFDLPDDLFQRRIDRVKGAMNLVADALRNGVPLDENFYRAACLNGGSNHEERVKYGVLLSYAIKVCEYMGLRTTVHTNGDIITPEKPESEESKKEANIISASKSFVKMMWNIVNEGKISVRNVMVRNFSYGKNRKPQSAIIELGAGHVVERSNRALLEENIPGIVEIRFDDEVRQSLVINGEGGEKYIVAMNRQGVLADFSPMNLDDEIHAQAVKILGVKPSAIGESRTLYTSPGATNNQVRMETFEASIPNSEINKMRKALARKGYSLIPVEEFAINTPDMSSFLQAIELIPSTQLTNVLEKRQAKEVEQKDSMPKEVPVGFFTYSKSAVSTSTDDMNALRRDPLMISLYYKLIKLGYDKADIEWLNMKDGKVKFASIGDFRKRGVGKSIPSPFFVRCNAVAGSILLGNELLTVRQARLATGQDDFEEVLAGTLPRGVASGKLSKERLEGEIYEETNLPEEVIKSLKEIFCVSGLFPSIHSLESIDLRSLMGDSLPEDMRSNLLSQTHGLGDEREAIKVYLTSLDRIIQETQDLKTLVLATLLKKKLSPQ